MKNLLILLKIVIVLCGTAGPCHLLFAASTPEASIPNGWISSPHMGFAAEDVSSTGFAKTGGSALFLDLTRKVGDHWEVGFRSIGNGAAGGDNGHRFLRLGTGPMAGYWINDSWVVQLHLGYFNETGLSQDDESLYRSRGLLTSLGWERTVDVSQRVQFAYGGYFSRHWGDIRSSTEKVSEATAAYISMLDYHLNNGGSHGLEIALRIHL